MDKRFLFSGALFAFMSVAAGAFGAHGLKKILDTDMLQVFETAVRYQMYHSLALILVSVIDQENRGKWVTRAGWFFIAGIALFSGSLYTLSLSGIKWIGIITPIGGVAFLGGWFSLLMYSLEKRKL